MRSRLGLFALLWLVFFGLFASTSASAFDESLSFRRIAPGSIEATVSGLTDTCLPIFAPANEVAIEGASISITSIEGGSVCGLPLYPPLAYRVTADLGILTGQSYHVVWTQPLDNGTTLQLSANLNPAAVGGGQAVDAPTLSWWGLGILTFALGALAVRQRRRRLFPE